MESVRTRDATNDTEREQLECPDRWAMTRSLSRSRRPPPTDRPTDRPFSIRISVISEPWNMIKIFMPRPQLWAGEPGRNIKKKTEESRRPVDNGTPRSGFCYLPAHQVCVCIRFMTLFFCSPSKIVFYDPEFGSATKLQ